MDQVYRELFTTEPKQDGRRWMDGVTLQRVRTTKAGGVLFVDSYPVYTSAMMRMARQIAAERKDKQETKEAQKRMNAIYARKRLEALANENFGAGDILMTLTWRTDDAERPETAADAKKQMDKYVRKVRGLRKRRGVDDMRYIYVIETTCGIKHGQQHHVHMLTGGDGVTEMELRKMWRTMHRDARVETDVVWDRPEGLTSWAAYVTKADNKGEKQTVQTYRRWYASKGLRKPKTTVSDKKLTRTKADRMARDFSGEGKKILEKLYPGYQVMELAVRTSDWLPGVYVYATLSKLPDEKKSKGGIRHDRLYSHAQTD